MLRLRFERLQRNLSQEALGVLARVSSPAISLIETGRFVPYGTQLNRLAVALGVSPDLLLQPVKGVVTDDSGAGVRLSVGDFREVPVAPVEPVA